MNLHDERIAMAFGLTDPGRTRQNNEDYFLMLPARNLYLLADGMGGHNAGEVASKMAVEVMGEFLSEEKLRTLGDDEAAIKKALTEGFHLANLTVLEAARQNPEHADMGTTLVAAIIDGSRLHVCHVGDVRAYILRNNGELKQITIDHSIIMELVLTGKLTKEEARLSPIKNQLSQAVGLMETLNPDCNAVDLREGDIIMLCSDGLWDMLPDQKIARIMQEGRGDAQRITEALVQGANDAGGEDNITVITVVQRCNTTK